MNLKEKERLLGFLLNALDEHEADQVKRELSCQPHLRLELAMLQRQLAPLNYIADSIEPPPQLANRTCAKIWATIDMEEKDREEDPVSQDSVLGTIVDPYKTLLNIPAASTLTAGLPERKPHAVSPKKQRPASFLSSHWMGLSVSALVGVVAAFFLFPMIRLVERSTRSFVTDNWMTEINRRVDQYEQIYSNPGDVPQSNTLHSVNLALSGWQELHPANLTATPFSQTPSVHSFEQWMTLAGTEGKPHYLSGTPHGLSAPLPLEREGFETPIPMEVNGLSDLTLLMMPEQGIPLRSAFGQGILLKEGRVFFRKLPSTEVPTQ